MTNENKPHEKEEGVLKPIFEIVKIRQVVTERDILRFTIRSPRDAVKFMQNEIADSDREVFLVLCLNTKNEVIAVHHAHVGALASCIVSPREVFKAAILNNASSVIFCHNHPSGHKTPSSEDIAVSERLYEGGQLLGIDVLDSIIVTTNDFTSLKDRGIF